MTESAKDMLRSLNKVAEDTFGAITLIAASPGTGKSMTLMHFKNSEPKALLMTAVAGEDDTPWGMACQLMERLNLGRPNNRDMRGSRQMIAEAIGIDRVLIIDEAQNLIRQNARGANNWESLEWLRALAEDGGFALAFSGDLSLLETAQRAPGLWRRMQRRVIIKGVSRNDVAAVADAYGITDDAIAEALFHLARRGGGLADVAGVIAHATRFAGGQQPGRAQVLAALEDLNLGGREGK